MKSTEHPECYIMACGIAATINYPLWKASAIAQSGFRIPPPPGVVEGSLRHSAHLMWTSLRPPYIAAPTVIFGLTWARSVIFLGSDWGRRKMRGMGFDNNVSTFFPPLVFSALVQCINMPLIRSTISMQNPKNAAYSSNTLMMLRHIVKENGIGGLWHGLNAGLAKTVPKYVVSVVIKVKLEDRLPQPNNKKEYLLRNTFKATVAGVSCAILTNPMDVLRNEMFKTNKTFAHSLRGLSADGYQWLYRGLGKNVLAVSFPISISIFFTDLFTDIKLNNFK